MPLCEAHNKRSFCDKVFGTIARVLYYKNVRVSKALFLVNQFGYIIRITTRQPQR